MWHPLFLFLIVITASCQNSDSKKETHLPPSHSNQTQLIGSEDKVCEPTHKSLPFEVGVKNTSSSSSSSDKSILATRQALLTVPESILLDFKNAKGQITLVDSFESYCQNSLFSCWSVNEHQNPQIFVSLLGKDQTWATSYLQKSVLNSIAMVHAEILEQHNFENGIAIEAKDPVIENVLFSISQHASEDLNLPMYIESGSSLYGILFAEYFCSQESKDNFLNILPKTKKDFDSIYQSSLGLFAPRTRANDVTTSTRNRSPDLKKTDTIIDRTPRNINIQFEGKGTAITDRTSQRLLETVKPDFKNLYTNLIAGHPRLQSDASGKYEKATSDFDYTYNGQERFFYSPKTAGNGQNIRNIDNVSGLGQQKPITIMVHGTKCSKSCVKEGKWAHPDSAMPENLRSHYGGDVISFQWSGKVNDSDRRQAGSVLADEIVYLRQQGFEVNLVGHSHGGNVIIDAINKAQTIDPGFETKGEFVSLARPVRNDYILQDKKLVSYFTVASGKGDIIQRLGGRVIGFGGRKDQFADLNVLFDKNKGQHNKLKKSILEVIEQSAITRRTEKHQATIQPLPSN